MPRKKTTKGKSKSWDDIGKTIGRKMDEEKSCTWSTCYHEKCGGGFFGRLVFIIALLFALSYSGMLVGIPSWVLVLIVIGFAFMKF